VGNVIVRVRPIVLPEVSAALLLQDPATACFAPGADAGDWTDEELCRRTVEAMEGGSREQWRVAAVVAAVQGRYKMLVRATEQHRGESEIWCSDLYGIAKDVGYRQGKRRGLEQGMRRSLLATYEARFGAVPPDVAAAVETMRSTRTLLQWQVEFSTRSARQIAAAVGARHPATSR
jgi:hypothetical protein